MILIVVFDEKYTVMQVPKRLDYNLVKLWEDFDEWLKIIRNTYEMYIVMKQK